MSDTPPTILMYARERFCPDVTRSRARLTALGLSWDERDIEADATAAAEVENLTGRRNVPTIVVGDAVLVEPSDDELDDALRGAGYEVAAEVTS